MENPRKSGGDTSTAERRENDLLIEYILPLYRTINIKVLYRGIFM